MKIDTNIKLKDYIKLMYILTYRRIGMKFASILGIFLFAFCIMYFIGIIESSEFPWLPIAYSAIIIIVMPLSIYYSAKNNYKTNARLQEKITYEISDELIRITGESFNSEMTWEKTYKVLELKNWFLFYQNKLVANIIPKESVGNQTQELRAIIKRQNINSKLKNN